MMVYHRIISPVEVLNEKRRLEKLHPEWKGKIRHFVDSDVYCCSSRSITLFIEVGKVKE